ncbi:MAG: ankyrin repeat domain-containing protein [Humibacillus sp.]|nr:ankyrin repeat domain-containing protein [Humibacillus sp.]MDN5777186.1 ankyrin repeat domain-containing protein [Humibacillus sp.]
MTESPISAADEARIVAVAMDLAREGNTAELAAFLEHSFPVDARDAQGNTLLMLAAYHGHLDTVVVLISHGADVDLPNERNQSPVAGAIFKGEEQIVRALVAAGADLDGGSPSARETAAMFGRTGLLELDGPDGPATVEV